MCGVCASVRVCVYVSVCVRAHALRTDYRQDFALYKRFNNYQFPPPPPPPSGCLPLLIQLLHGSDKDSGLLGNTRGSAAARARASAALHNIVHSNPDDKRGRREARTLRLLEQIRAHCDQQRGESAEEEEEEGGAGEWRR